VRGARLTVGSRSVLDITLVGNLSRNLFHFSSPFLHLPHSLPQATSRCSRAWSSPAWTCTSAHSSQVCLYGLVWGTCMVYRWGQIGNRCGPRPSPLMGTFPGTFFISSHTFPPPPLPNPGNIEVFKGMQIKALNLQSCSNLRGECVELGWWVQDQ